MPESFLKSVTEEKDDSEKSEDEKNETANFRVKYKTEKCKNWQTGNMTCKYGDRCSFAHGAVELKTRTDTHRNYKTKLCKRFHKDLYCPYGQRCQFLHDEDNSGALSPDLATVLLAKPLKKVKKVKIEEETATPFVPTCKEQDLTLVKIEEDGLEINDLVGIVDFGKTRRLSIFESITQK